MPLCQSYGFAETCGFVCAQALDDRSESAGAPLDGTTIDIDVDNENEVVVRGSVVCSTLIDEGYVVAEDFEELALQKAGDAILDDGAFGSGTGGRLDGTRLVPLPWGRRSDELMADVSQVFVLIVVFFFSC